MVLQIILLALGFVLLVKGADLFVDGAAGIATKLHIPQLIIGLTIVAMGTSLPEAAVSITSAIDQSAGISIGNIVGSNIMNILIILGVTAVIATITVQKSTLRFEIPFMIGITALLLVFGLTGAAITFWEGVVFLALFAFYLFYLFKVAKNDPDQETDPPVNMVMWKCLLFIGLGAVMVVVGSNFAVDSAVYIAQYLGVSERIIGLTIVAFGTSLPELVTSVTAARKGQSGIAIGNIVGSNIFNILFVLGITSLICDVSFESKFILDTAIAIGAAVLLFVCAVRTKALNRVSGIIMLAAYVGYFVFMCL